LAKKSQVKHSMLNLTGVFLSSLEDFIHIFSINYFNISWLLRLFQLISQQTKRRSRRKKQKKKKKKNASACAFLENHGAIDD